MKGFVNNNYPEQLAELSQMFTENGHPLLKQGSIYDQKAFDYLQTQNDLLIPNPKITQKLLKNVEAFDGISSSHCYCHNFMIIFMVVILLFLLFIVMNRRY